jgi:hypothetical protein
VEEDNLVYFLFITEFISEHVGLYYLGCSEYVSVVMDGTTGQEW